MTRPVTTSADPNESSGLEDFGREVRDRIRTGFDPSPATVARVERRVVSAFRAAVVQGRLAVAPEPAPGRRAAFAARLRASWRWRVLAFAAVLAVMTTGATMAAQTSPGRPLFAARLALETALLPGGTSPSRIDAQLARLARRVAEVTDAIRDGDAGAAAAAARAYRETLGDLPGLVRQHPERTVAVRRALSDHLHALEALAGRTGGETSEAVGAAIHDTRAVRRSLAEVRVGPGLPSISGSAWPGGAGRRGRPGYRLRRER